MRHTKKSELLLALHAYWSIKLNGWSLICKLLCLDTMTFKQLQTQCKDLIV